MSIELSVVDTSRLTWTKSSYSSNDGPNCVEVVWHKSSYSGSDNNDCVEVAAAREIVLVRDSKNVTGPRLGVAPGTWAAFLAHVSAT